MKKEDILQIVSDETGIPVEKIVMEDWIPGAMKQEYVAARSLCAFLMYKYCTYTIPEITKKETMSRIGRLLNRHGNTISRELKSINDLLETNLTYKNQFEEIENIVKSKL